MAVATPSSLPRLTKNMSTHRYMINLINGRNGRADLEGSSCRYKCLVNHDGIFDCASTYYSVSQATALALALALTASCVACYRQAAVLPACSAR